MSETGGATAPDITRNMPGERGKRFVVREEQVATVTGQTWKFGVWDRMTGQRVACYGSRVGANRMAFGLEVGWDIQAAYSYANRGDRWASVS